MNKLDPIYLIGAIATVAGVLAVLRVYFKRGTENEWEKVAGARGASIAEAERIIAALRAENEHLRRERDAFERQVDRRLNEILELHAELAELKRELSALKGRSRRLRDEPEKS